MRIVYHWVFSYFHGSGKGVRRGGWEGRGVFSLALTLLFMFINFSFMSFVKISSWSSAVTPKLYARDISHQSRKLVPYHPFERNVQLIFVNPFFR